MPWRVLEARGAQSAAIRGNRFSSVELRGTQRHLEALSGTQRPSEALSGTQWHSEAVRGHKRPSVALRFAQVHFGAPLRAQKHVRVVDDAVFLRTEHLQL